MTLARAILIVPAVAGALLLAGCTAGTAAPDEIATPAPTPEPAAEQSVAEACDEVEEGMRDFAPIVEAGDPIAAAQADPVGMLAKWQTAESTLAGAVEGVSNDEVGVAAEGVVTAMHDLVVFMERGSADPTSVDLATVQPMVESLMASLVGLNEFCAA